MLKIRDGRDGPVVVAGIEEGTAGAMSAAAAPVACDPPAALATVDGACGRRCPPRCPARPCRMGQLLRSRVAAKRRESPRDNSTPEETP